MEISGIIVGAGEGKRIGNRNKSFLKILDKDILAYSFEVLKSIPEIKEIVIVLNEDNIKNSFEYLTNPNTKVVQGGRERWQSVQNGIRNVQHQFVLIHDAARPIINRNFIYRIINGMSEKVSGVIPAVPVKATIKQVSGDFFVEKTVPRDYLFEVQTPQLFRKEVLLDAYDKVCLTGITDESVLLERLKVPVKVVEGLEENIKITTSFDLIVAEGILKQWKQE